MSDAFDATPAELRTLRLRLRPLGRDDASAVHAYAFTPDVARFLPWRPLSSELFAKGLVQAITQPQFLSWAVTQPPADAAIGMVFLHAFSRQHQKAEVAFNLAQAHWNRGIAAEAAAAVLHYALHELGLNRVEALCMPENLASKRVLEKLGMACEGRMRRVHRRYDGYHDMDLYAVLAPPAANLRG